MVFFHLTHFTTWNWKKSVSSALRRCCNKGRKKISPFGHFLDFCSRIFFSGFSPIEPETFWIFANRVRDLNRASHLLELPWTPHGFDLDSTSSERGWACEYPCNQPGGFAVLDVLPYLLQAALQYSACYRTYFSWCSDCATCQS